MAALNCVDELSIPMVPRVLILTPLVFAVPDVVEDWPSINEEMRFT